MKKMLIIMAATAALALSGCATTRPRTLSGVAPVGPNPGNVALTAGNGQLEVFSALSGRTEGNNPTWLQHSDYNIYTTRGRRVKHVMNAAGYYSTLPRLVKLPAGEYIVKARAKGALWTTVSVVIKPGEITRVHLDGKWEPNAPGAEIVMAPEGYPVGWRAGK
jgi:hypothetical protein